MPNYVPKEKKLVLNMETVKKDLKKALKLPPFARFGLFLLLVALVGVLIFLIWLLIYQLTEFSAKGFSIDLLYLIGTVIALPRYLVIMLKVGGLLIEKALAPILTNFGKFHIMPDTLKRKVLREQVRVYITGEGDRDGCRYPNVLYFEKCGRFELRPNTEEGYVENDSRRESKAQHQLDSYELEKEYIVVTFGKKRPKIAVVYDPDDYDVQL